MCELSEVTITSYDTNQMIQISLERMLTGYKVIIEGGYYFAKSNLPQMTKLAGEFAEKFFNHTGERPAIRINPRKKTFLKLEPYVEDLATKMLEHIVAPEYWIINSIINK
jgi:hypothetical protein